MPLLKGKHKEEPKEKLYTIDEMAALLDVEKRTLVEWVQYRQIPYIVVNGELVRFRVSEIVEWVKSKKKDTRQKFQIR